jgi:hypothetical protein
MSRQRTEKLVKLYGDYVFPIAYPDLSIGPLVYVKRIRGALFADLAINQYNTYTQNSSLLRTTKEEFYSFGIDLSIDYHLLRTMFPLNTGVRIGYLPEQQSFFAELLFGIDLYSF